MDPSGLEGGAGMASHVQEFSAQEIERRREAALKRMLSTPHKPHKATLGKAKRKAVSGARISPGKPVNHSGFP